MAADEQAGGSGKKRKDGGGKGAPVAAPGALAARCLRAGLLACVCVCAAAVCDAAWALRQLRRHAADAPHLLLLLRLLAPRRAASAHAAARRVRRQAQGERGGVPGGQEQGAAGNHVCQGGRRAVCSSSSSVFVRFAACFRGGGRLRKSREHAPAKQAAGVRVQQLLPGAAAAACRPKRRRCLRALPAQHVCRAVHGSCRSHWLPPPQHCTPLRRRHHIMPPHPTPPRSRSAIRHRQVQAGSRRR